MRVFVRNTTLEGKPLDNDGQVFAGDRLLDVVLSMKGAALFSDHGSIREYIDMLLRNAKVLAGLELRVTGETPEDLAESLLTALVEHKLAEILEEVPPLKDADQRVPIPEAVYAVIDGIRRSGVTNMLDRNMVVEIARQLNFPDEAAWIDKHRREYSEAIFRGARPVCGRVS